MSSARPSAKCSRFAAAAAREPRGKWCAQWRAPPPLSPQARQSGLSRDERATTEHVLDPRTRLLLFKLLNSGVLGAIHGCVSTGKEVPLAGRR